MDQRTDTWMSWRKKGLGGSEIAATLHLHPDLIQYASAWMSPYALWEIKTGRSEGFKGNWATERGNALEAPARAWFEVWMISELGEVLDFEPETVVHPLFDRCRCSLDGHSAARREILEIKCPGAGDHQLAKSGQVPEKYYAQVQYQLAVTQAELAYYFSFDGKEGAVVKVTPDKDFGTRLMKIANEFWNDYVLKDTPPPFVPLDTKKIRDKDAVMLAESLKQAHDAYNESHHAIQQARTNYEALKMKVTERFCKYTRAECGPMIWTKQCIEFKEENPTKGTVHAEKST